MTYYHRKRSSEVTLRLSYVITNITFIIAIDTFKARHLVETILYNYRRQIFTVTTKNLITWLYTDYPRWFSKKLRLIIPSAVIAAQTSTVDKSFWSLKNYYHFSIKFLLRRNIWFFGNGWNWSSLCNVVLVIHLLVVISVDVYLPSHLWCLRSLQWTTCVRNLYCIGRLDYCIFRLPEVTSGSSKFFSDSHFFFILLINAFHLFCQVVKELWKKYRCF